MKNASTPIIFLSGAGGGAPDFGAFRDGVNDKTCFEVVGYPGWRSYVSDQYSAELLIADLAAQVMKKVQDGPIRIIGLSIGGHFGYAIGLHLQAMGRDIAGLCAIDSFMFGSAKPSPGWKGRALAEVVELLRKERFGDLTRFLRSRFWRALARFACGRSTDFLRRLASSRWSSALSSVDPIFEEELSMRLLIEMTAPWMISLDQKPAVLKAPAILLRTTITDSDDAWRRRCPNVKIFEISGQHNNLFEPENVGSLRRAFVAATYDW
jgi:thioesterase domain-containing protein